MRIEIWPPDKGSSKLVIFLRGPRHALSSRSHFISSITTKSQSFVGASNYWLIAVNQTTCWAGYQLLWHYCRFFIVTRQTSYSTHWMVYMLTINTEILKKPFSSTHHWSLFSIKRLVDCFSSDHFLFHCYNTNLTDHYIVYHLITTYITLVVFMVLTCYIPLLSTDIRYTSWHLLHPTISCWLVYYLLHPTVSYTQYRFLLVTSNNYSI